jgi:hypothetical protein
MLRNCGDAPGHQRLRQQRIALAHGGVIGEIAVADERADAHAAVRRCLDVLQRQMRDVDEPRRLLDVALHQVKQVGAAG